MRTTLGFHWSVDLTKAIRSRFPWWHGPEQAVLCVDMQIPIGLAGIFFFFWLQYGIQTHITTNPTMAPKFHGWVHSIPTYPPFTNLPYLGGRLPSGWIVEGLMSNMK